MKKKLLCVLLCVCLLSGSLSVGAAASFTDIPDPQTALAANVLHSLGIVDGVSEGIFSPGTVLTRAQFCVLLIHTLDLKDLVNAHSYKALFTDVKPGSWYTGYVNLAYSRGLLSGYGNGKFGPDDPVTYGQAATLLLRVLGYSSADVGTVWPADYVNYAHTLELDKGLQLTADRQVTRGEAAVLLYNTLYTHPKGSAKEYYYTFSGAVSAQPAILLDVSAENGTATNQLMACAVTATGASIEYFSQKNQVSDGLVGYEGELLLNASGKVLGFLPGSSEMKDVVIRDAKASGIIDPSGANHRIPGSTVTIVGDELYTWSNTGYIQVDGLSGRTARLFYDDDGAVCYVYVSTGITNSNTTVVFSETDSTAAELARKLGVTGSCSMIKNGSVAGADDLAKYDTAYFDAASGTLCVSDYRITGYIQAASPALDAAQSVTISGCTIPVLEAAWDTLSSFRLGDRVTLLLTDDCKVAAALPESQVRADMIGVLSRDGSGIRLYDSGLTLTAPRVDADEELRGTLVRVHAEEDSLSCFAYSSKNSTGTLSTSLRTLGEYPLAPTCRVYEHSASSLNSGYVYSLSGEPGVPSSDFDEIFWTNSIESQQISSTHLNSAGQIDLILLNHVTGNDHTYGALTSYTGMQGIMTASSPRPVYNSAVTITNAQGSSQKYLSSHVLSSHNAFFGISLGSDSSAFQEVLSLVKLTKAPVPDNSGFFLREDEWFISLNGCELPVSDRVQVLVEATGQWLGGSQGVKTAASSNLPVVIHYDKTPDTGAQVRVIVIEEHN